MAGTNLTIINSGLHSVRGFQVGEEEEAVDHFRREVTSVVEVRSLLGFLLQKVRTMGVLFLVSVRGFGEGTCLLQPTDSFLNC